MKAVIKDVMKDLITQEIIRFVSDYQNPTQIVTRWSEPLVGFANTNDSLFSKLKKAVGHSHALPDDLLENAQTVIVYFIPFSKDIPKENRHNHYASRQWVIAYIETNQLIIDINNYLSRLLAKRGFNTALLPPTHNFDKQRLISNWSHKHIAYIAGLGKFGMHYLLITHKGCCGRLGSIITNARIEATQRPEIEYCLHKYNKTCV
jgi:epoxyqueuosine reductase QueG